MRGLAKGRAGQVLVVTGVAAWLASCQTGNSAPLRDGVAVPCDPATFGLLIDVGHTRSAPGATSARGKTEYSFNLKPAQRIQQALQSAEFARARLLLTEAPQHSQLAARSEQANAMKPDLFLSVHHDDVQPRYHAKWAFEGRQYSYSDRFSGHSIFVSSANRQFDASRRFAKFLGTELAARGMRYSPHHAENIPGERRRLIDPDVGVYQYDQLHVLRTVHAPAVLLEAGIITNRNDELILDSAERRDLIGGAVVAAAREFCHR